MAHIHWYPGHIAKAERKLKELLNLVDVVIEVLDARIPDSSVYPDIKKLLGDKPRLIILNKADLADEAQLKAWLEFYGQQTGFPVIASCASKNNDISVIVNKVTELAKPKIDKLVAKGLLPRPARVMVVGMPNVGKSSIIAQVSAARPEIAAYHFTTLTPVLGVVRLDEERSFVLADIPGLIEGAHEGVGLGHDFLRHVERTKVLLHIVDVAGVDGRDPIEDFDKINNELAEYSERLARRKQLVLANKMDLPDAQENFERLKEYVEAKGYEIFKASAATGEGLRELMYKAYDLLLQYEPEEDEEED